MKTTTTINNTTINIRLRFTSHATERAILREVSNDRIAACIATPDKIFADGEADRYGAPIYIFNKRFKDGRVLRVVSSARNNVCNIITVYYCDAYQIKEIGL
jgi:hypothetical protein